MVVIRGWEESRELSKQRMGQVKGAFVWRNTFSCSITQQDDRGMPINYTFQNNK